MVQVYIIMPKTTFYYTYAQVNHRPCIKLAISLSTSCLSSFSNSCVNRSIRSYTEWKEEKPHGNTLACQRVFSNASHIVTEKQARHLHDTKM